jgi:hypothetical protein
MIYLRILVVAVWVCAIFNNQIMYIRNKTRNRAKVMLFSVLLPRAGRFSAPFYTKQTMSFSLDQDLNLDFFIEFFFQIV